MKSCRWCLLGLILMMSCSKDDFCNNAQFTGTWTGNISCDKQTIPITTSVILTQGSNDHEIIMNGGDFMNEVVKRNDCALEGVGDIVFGMGTKITGTISSDNKILTLIIGEESVNCTYNLVK
ncbi:MAG: hypothetical protein IPO92_00540 [Saprospiraceae bacterium]|nr:hypothetical protein [Saprospiraceae bacterium]